MDRYDDTRNNEGYTDSTAHKAIRSEERNKKAFYVFKTMISCARLAGFYVNADLVIEDHDGNKYNSTDILRKGKQNV